MFFFLKNWLVVMKPRFMVGQLIVASFQIYNCFGGSIGPTILISLIDCTIILGKTVSAIWEVQFGESQICTQHFGVSQICTQHFRESQIAKVPFPQIAEADFPLFWSNRICHYLKNSIYWRCLLLHREH